MNKFKTMIPYFFLTAALFYLLPMLGNSTGGFMVILLVIMPLTCFAISFVYGLKNGINMYFSVAVGLLFIPTIFIYFNSTAWVYIVGYSLISSAGVFIGKTVNSK